MPSRINAKRVVTTNRKKKRNVENITQQPNVHISEYHQCYAVDMLTKYMDWHSIYLFEDSLRTPGPQARNSPKN